MARGRDLDEQVSLHKILTIYNFSNKVFRTCSKPDTCKWSMQAHQIFIFYPMAQSKFLTSFLWINVAPTFQVHN